MHIVITLSDTRSYDKDIIFILLDPLCLLFNWLGFYKSKLFTYMGSVAQTEFHMTHVDMAHNA